MQVAWLRGGDGAILSVGLETFVWDRRIDSRYSVMGDLETWSLRIRGVTPRDRGKYECQV